ncbi:MAG: hypothetical protein IIZ39_08845 [Blautia sp.]|nr:hypothetical protein [Blautia sp.]
MNAKPETLQNLKDAGCPQEMIKAFLTACEDNREADAIRLLKKHRQSLLAQVHSNEAKIDCLDYLLFQMTAPGKT